MPNEYLIQPELSADRKADYKKGEEINKKWKPISSSDLKYPKAGTNGNIGHTITVNTKTKKIKFNKELYSFTDEKNISLYQTISAALALYRVVCMIENPIVETQGAAGYKVPWNVNLIHTETGEVLSFGEWKGAFGIWTRFSNLNELPASYKKDVEEILNLLFSNKSPHPYDNCTAGGVA